MQTKRPLLALTGVAGAILLTMTMAACGTIPGQDPPGASSPSAGGKPASSANATPTPPPPAPVVFTPNVANGAKGVKVSTLVSVKASAGTLSKVKLSYKGKDKQGESQTVKVPGQVSAKGDSWTATSALDPGANYQLTMVGKNASNQATTKSTAAFTTQKLTLDQQTFPSIFPFKGDTVGVGMPVILTFDVPVKNRKEFQKHLSVTASDHQVGSWHWYGDQTLHWRPKNYWKPGTKVSVTANLNGVDAGGGIYGQQSTSTSFTIGRAVVTKINLDTHRAKVYINGDLKRTIPISGGRKGWSSRSGTKLIMEKLPVTRMTNQMIGASEDYDLKVKYAMRVTNSGEFLHAAPWAEQLGVANTSHGCVGMSTANANWLFNQVTLGSPVITTGSNRGLEQGNGWSDWDISFSEYKKGSAL